MNKIYKVIWNATLLAWVAVSELAKGKTKSSKVTGIIGAATVSLMVTFSPDVIANTIDMQPQGTRNDTDCVSAGNTTVYKAQTNGTTAPITDGSGTYSTVAGCNASGGGVLAATVYGSHSKVTGKGGTAVGHNNEAAQWALAAGVDSKATGESSIALGAGAAASNTSSIAIGTDSGASGSGALALMAGSKANAISSIAIGQTSSTGAAAEGSIAIGRNAQTSASGSIAIGDGATATGGTTDINSIAIGKGAQSWGQSFALGTGASADSLTFDVNDSGVAVGAQSVTAAGTTKGTAIGVNSKVTGSTVAGTAIGSNAVASIDNSVALGSNSTTSAITGTGFLTSQAAPTVGAVSVGNGTAAGNRRIQNVADGSAASDAVTVAQLDKAYDDTNGRLATVLGAGSGAAYNATNNTYTAPTNIGGTGKTTIDDAIKATQRSVVAGSNIVITPTTAADGSISYSVATSATPTFTSVTVNNAPTAGTDATNKTYVDSKAAASKTEVTAGTNVSGVAKTTGANGQDVYTVNANGTTASAGSSAVTVTAGTKNASNVTDYKVDLSTATKTDIQKGVDAKTAVDSTGLTFKGDTTATSATKKLGDTVSITGDTNISTVATTDGVQVKLNPNLNLGTTGSVTTGATVINNAGITANKVTINNAPTAGTDATNKTYVDSKAAASRTEVAAGSNVSGVVKTTGANGQDVYTVNANGTTASAGSSAVTVTPGTKDANNVTDYKVDLSATTKTDIQKGVDAKTAVDSTGLKFKGDTATTSATKKLGDTVSITGDTNISTVATTDGVQVKLNPNLDLGTAGSVKTGNTTINNAGVTADQVTVGGVVINKTTGINAGGLAITNVAAPTAGTDATNKTYVDSKAAASRTEVAAGSNVSGVVKTTGANGQDVYTVNANGTTASAGSSAVTVTPGTKDANNVTDYKVDLSATTKTDIQKGVDAKTAVDTTGLKFKGDTATTSNTKKLGDTVSITGDTNISTVATTDGVQVKLNPNLDLGATGSVKTGNTTINNAGVTADQVTVGGVVINNTSGINAGGKAITNVAAPTNNTDAANKKYVDDAGAALTNLGFGLKAQDGTTVNKKLGEAVDIVGSNSNISTKVNAGKVEVALSNTLDLGTTGSITTGSTVINNAGVTANKVTINNAPTAGTDATNKTYVDSKAAASRTEVAAGSNVSGVVKTTGANGQDVYTVNANGTTASAGSSAVTVTPGTKDANNVTDYKVDLSATTKTDIQKGVDAKTAVDTTGLKFKGDTATTSNTKKLGDTVSITGDTNISTVATTDGVQVKLNPNLDLGATGSVKTGNTTINNAGVTADQVTVGGVVINNTSGINAGGKAITNVAAPTNNTDAANKKYVDDAGTALTNLGFGLKAQDGTTVNKKLGEAVEVVGADSNITTKVAGGQVAIELNKNLNNLTGITVNDGTNGTNGSTVIGKDGISVKDGSGNTIAGVDNTALTVKDGSGNTETSINQAINTLNAAQGETDKFAVKYDKNADGSVNYNNVTLAGTNGTTISNVKAGAVTSTSTDAINGSQLYGVANSVKNAIGGSTTIDATTGAITTTNIGGTGSNTIDGAISSIKDSATKAKTTVSAGDNVVVTSGTNADGSTNYEVATAKDVNFDKVTVGSVVVDKSSNTIKGLSNTTWNGTAVSGQAATEDQLKTVSDAQGETDKFAVKYDKNADGSANYNNITLAGTTASSTQDATTGKITTTGGTSLNNVASAGDYKDVANASKGVNAGDLNNAVVDATNAATSKGFALQAADGAKVQKNLGEAVEVVGADSNITTKVVGGQVAIELNKNLNNLTGITVNDGTNGTNGSTVIGKDGISVKDGSGNTIAGVDNTALTVKDSSGNTETSINQAINTLNAAQGETDKFAVKYDKNADGSANYNNITLAGTTASSTQDATTGKITTTGGTSLNNVASAGDYKDVANASKGVNAGDLNNAVVDATNAATSKGFALQAADGAKVQKNLGEAVEVVGADSNITTKVVGGQVAIELNKNLNNLTGITVNDGTNGTNGSTVIGKDGISVKDGSGNTIAGVDNTALTVKDSSGNTETSINQAINTLNAAQGETDKFAVKYDKNADGSVNYNNITLAGTTASSTQDATTGKITTTGGTSLNNVASAGDYKDVANASKGVNAGDLNNAVVDATNAATSKGFALQAADGAKVQKNLGEAVEVVGADSNITTKVVGGQVAIELNKNLNNLTGITVNDGTNGTNGSTVIGKDGISVKDGSGNTIAGVDNTALTVKDSSGNTETSINQAINTLNAAQGETDKFAVKYDKNADGSVNYNNITLAGTTASSTQDATTGKITTTGGTSLNNVASAGDYKDVANASKGVNAGDLNNAVVDATNAATSKGFALQAADGAKVQKNLGEAVEVVGADSNITTKVVGGQVAIELNKNLNNLTGITVNDGTNGTNGSTVIGKDGISVKDGSGNTIAGVDNTALTVKDSSGNTETSINQAINTLNAAQGETDKFAVKYDKNADGSANYNNITLAGTTASSTQDATTGKITTTGGTSLNNVASAGDYKDVANASKGVNAGDLNNAVVDATNAATSKGFALQAADGAKVQKNLGEAVEVVGADSNITTKVAGGQVAIELNKNLNNLTGITVNDGTEMDP
ncbi:ESPR-type extended signal peptide-containing protein [Acinetobacter bereziniae]|nr:ESPR-type extended signal peptide-containing protein [Acinetobacter bereziniae]WMW74663.1 ESPR-type extended signal peptide-containing protein [Acinetobacter bereziniae]